LPEELRAHDVIRWPEAIRSFRLKLWDEEAGRLVPFPKADAVGIVAAE
jgi:omega-6 fatty acid desaturase (delta-12 desaturase)